MSEETDETEQPAAPAAPMHVAAVLVASSRALGNALDELGFAEDDDRVVELDGRLGFMTCSHERESDDMFALIAEMASRGETWEIQFRVDVSATRSIFHTLSRHQAISGVEEETVMPEEPAVDGASAPVHDLSTDGGMAALKSAVRRVKAADVFAEIGSGRDGRSKARILQRVPRRLLVEATAPDEPTLRTALREIIPNVMFSVSRPTAD